MKLTISVNTPTRIERLSEFARNVISRSAYMEVTIDVPDHIAADVAEAYRVWTGEYDASATTPVAASEAAAMAYAPPVSPIPTAPVAAGPVAMDIMSDKVGVPYNPDLHAALTGRSGGMNENGEWKLKRGGDRLAYNAWKARHATTAPAPAAVAQTAAPAPTANPFGMPAPLEDPGAEVVSAKATALAQAGKLTPVEVSKMMTSLGVTDNMVLLTDPTIRPKVWQYLQKLAA